MTFPYERDEDGRETRVIRCKNGHERSQRNVSVDPRRQWSPAACPVCGTREIERDGR